MRSALKARNQKGSLLVEMVVALPIFIAMIGLCMDGVFGLMACQILDDTCIDAARAASLGRTKEEASYRAAAVARSHQRSGMVPEVAIVQFDNKDCQYWLGPVLTLETKVTYQLPFPIIVFNKEITPPALKMARRYTYPILPVYKEPPMAAAEAPPPFDDSYGEGEAPVAPPAPPPV